MSRVTGRAALVLAVIATVLFGIDLAIRPPCPENYVRLVDVEPLLPFVTGALAIGGFVVSRLSRRPGAHRLAGLAGGGLLVVSLFAGVVATVGSWVTDLRPRRRLRSALRSSALSSNVCPPSSLRSSRSKAVGSQSTAGKRFRAGH